MTSDEGFKDIEWRTSTMDIFYEASLLHKYQKWADDTSSGTRTLRNTEESEFFLDLINNLDLDLNEVVREYGPNNSRYGKPDGAQADLLKRLSSVVRQVNEERHNAVQLKGSRDGTRHFILEAVLLLRL